MKYIDLTLENNGSGIQQFPLTFNNLITVYTSNSTFSDSAVTSEPYPQVKDGAYKLWETPVASVNKNQTAGWVVNKTFPAVVEQFEFVCKVKIPEVTTSVFNQLIGYGGTTSSKRFTSPVLQLFSNQIVTNLSEDGTAWSAGKTIPVTYSIGDVATFIFGFSKTGEGTGNKYLKMSLNDDDFVELENENLTIDHIATPTLLSLFFSQKDSGYNVFAGDIYMKETKLTINNEVFVDCGA